MAFRSAYDGVRVNVGVDNRDDDGEIVPSRTQQHMRAESDVNNIIRKFDTTGLLDHVNRAVAQYGDYTTVNEYSEALALVQRAQYSFDFLPSDIRRRFGNDPGSFFEFATNPDNASELVKMGLASEILPDLPPEPLSVRVVESVPTGTVD